ncbi:type VI secretion system protein TssL, long form [Thaumasiovibrio subtropicus]|uniref:type VI secretion system protein TssL, long form n=1 Tax=Thaumasiovibrio subtropicus TaxID=1891207 RepID=UPI000B359005|nr:type VI secretion system protein TssL, long form [Thaumasiovibrio subtropicus]
MAESTLIKPRPGGRARSGDVATPPPAQSGDSTVLLTKIAPTSATVTHRLPSLGDNAVVDEASVLLSLVGQIRSTSNHGDVASLRQACIDKVRDYESRLRQQGVNNETIESARYCVCCLIDETVLNTVWGEQSVWTRESLLSTFYADTWGGEHFYNLLDASLKQPGSFAELLELQYLCLTLGFIGKLRIEEQGREKHEDYRHRAYKALKDLKGATPEPINTDLEKWVVLQDEHKESMPAWVTMSLFAMITLAVYMFFNYRINEQSNGAFVELSTLVPLTPSEVVEEEFVEDPSRNQIRQLLQTEVDRGLIEFIDMTDRLRIIIKSSELFNSGSADVEAHMHPLLSKVGRSLETTTGRIMVVGHTDDRPIFTSKFPSNWHLSLARATSVANLLAMGNQLSGRLWPEGMGETSPRFPNDSDENRARNRRVEIDIMFDQRRAGL